MAVWLMKDWESFRQNSAWLVIQKKRWQGKKDSNLRMLESKSSALTSLAIPLQYQSEDIEL